MIGIREDKNWGENCLSWFITNVDLYDSLGTPGINLKKNIGITISTTVNPTVKWQTINWYSVYIFLFIWIKISALPWLNL